MRLVPFPVATPIATPMTAIGFGCAALLGRASRKESETAVATALDAGITFFDTARPYGYGQSEGLLGKMIAGRRQNLVLCTKFGILPAQRNWKSQFLPIARKVVRTFPALRKAAQRQAGTQFTGGQFSLETLHSSLETSLRELRTDYVDILLMHEAPASVLAQEDLLEALARLVESGKVLLAGLSATPAVISRFLTQRPPILKTAQFALNATRMNFVTETQRGTDLLLVANHPFGGPGGVAAKATLTALSTSPALLPDLRDKLAGPQLLPELLFNLILTGTGISAVVPAMMQPAHIHANIRAVNNCRFTPAELSAMRTVLTQDS